MREEFHFNDRQTTKGFPIRSKGGISGPRRGPHLLCPSPCSCSISSVLLLLRLRHRCNRMTGPNQTRGSRLSARGKAVQPLGRRVERVEHRCRPLSWDQSRGAKLPLHHSHHPGQTASLPSAVSLLLSVLSNTELLPVCGTRFGS